MENKNVTALEWLAQKLDIAPDNPLFKQAIAIEKEQIIEAYQEGDGNGTATEWGYEVINAEQYYEDTYGK